MYYKKWFAKIVDRTQRFVCAWYFKALSFFLMIAGTVTGQNSITPYWPDRGVIMRDQLWNISFINSQSEPISIEIEMVVSDAISGAGFISATSRTMLVAPGVKIISAFDALPANYLLLSSAYIFNPAVNSLIPPGIFEICYKVRKTGGETMNMDGGGCFPLESDAFVPPLLILPENEKVIDTRRPFFNWLPPVPSNSFALLNYSMKLFEVESLQSPQEAAERNIPLFQQYRIVGNSINYPGNLPLLDSGKTYTWQVLAYNDINYVAASECWSFSVTRDSLLLPVTDGSVYSPLVSSGSCAIINIHNQLKLTYNNESGDTLLNGKISSQLRIQDSIAEIFECPVILQQAGTNYLVIDLNTIEGLRRGVLYELSFINARKEKWWIDFVWNKD